MLDLKGSRRAVEEHARKEAAAWAGKLPGLSILIVVHNCEGVMDVKKN